MRSRTAIAATAALFALFHVIIVAIPVVTSGGSGESQGFAAAIVDFPIVWLLGLFPAGSRVLYGSSQTLYILIFSIGGTLMYACVGAVLGYALHGIIRAFRAA